MKRFDMDHQSSSSSPEHKRQRLRPGTPASVSDLSGTCQHSCVKGRSDLLLANLSMFPGEESCEREDSCAAVNGKSKQRIQQLLKGKLCNCTRKCVSSLTFRLLYGLCVSFWNLSKAAQDCVLWGIQNLHKGAVAASPDSEEEDSQPGSDCESDPGSSTSSSGDTSDGESESSSDSDEKVLNSWYIQGRAKG